MDLPGLNFRPRKVVEAEILRKFGLPVCPSSSPPSSEFLLVLSFGRCKYELNELSAALILESVIRGSAGDFRVRSLGHRVFRFSVSSQVVGFHIYKLRSYENSNFKLFFNMKHDAGPRYQAEFNRWIADEQAQWATIVNRKLPQLVCSVPPLTDANAIPVQKSDHGGRFHFLNSAIPARQSVFNRIKFNAGTTPTVSPFN